MTKISDLADHAVASGAVSGISFSVFGPDENEIYVQGFQGQGPDHIPLSPDAIYDLASLTKVVSTTTRILQLMTVGQLRLSSRVGEFVPDCAYPDLTVGLLMLHRSGLPPDVPNVHLLTRAQLVATIKATKLVHTPDTVTEYSDLNYILLGWIIHAIDGDLSTSLTEHIFAPLGMKQTAYNPHAPLRDFVPTEEQADRGGVIRGQVHDYKAYLLDGVSGHAGLFSTLRDLTHFTRVLAGLQSSPVVSSGALQLLAKYDVGGRTLGWRRWSHGEQYWHTGFTGTAIGFDRATQRGFVCLTNRVYPHRTNRQFLDIRRAMLATFFGTNSVWG